MLKRDANEDHTYGGINWAMQIKNILNEIGMSHLWYNQNVNMISFQSIQQRILDI